MPNSNPTSSIAYAQLVVFAVLALPATYNLIKHGARGFLAWFYVCLFCGVRIVGSAMEINDLKKDKLSIATEVVSSLGLSPLMLSAAGVLHEARKARGVHRLNGCGEWILVIQYHLFVAVGIVIVASRAGALSARTRKQIDQTMLDVGFAIIDVCWGLLALGTCVSLRPHQKRPHSKESYQLGTKLLYAALISIPLIGARVIYSTVCYAGNSATATNSLALKVIFGVVPEMLVVVVFVLVGILTQELGILRRIEKSEKRRMVASNSALL